MDGAIKDRIPWRNPAAGLRRLSRLLGVRDCEECLAPSQLLFTVGCQRSGTTLLNMILSQHAAIASIDEPESNDFLRRGCRRSEATAAGVGERMLLNLKMPRMGFDPPGAVFSRLLKKGARAIYLTRDPRAVATSMMRLEWPGGRWADVQPPFEVKRLSRECRVPIPPGYSAWRDWQRCLHHLFLKHRFYELHLAGPQTLPVCYERLVAQPQEQLQRIVEWLDIPFDEVMLEHHRQGSGEAIGRTRRDRAIDTRSVSTWREYLTAEQVAEVGTVCADALAYWRAAAGEEGAEPRSVVSSQPQGLVVHHRPEDAPALPA